MIKGHPEIPVIDVVAYGLMLMVEAHCIRMGKETLGPHHLDVPEKNVDKYFVISRLSKDGQVIIPVAHEFNFSDQNDGMNRRALASLEAVGLVERESRFNDRFFGKFSDAGKTLMEAFEAIEYKQLENLALVQVRADPSYDIRHDQLILALLDYVLLHCSEISVDTEIQQIRAVSSISWGEWAIEILVSLGILDQFENCHWIGLVGENVSRFEDEIGAPPRELRVRKPEIRRFGNYVEGYKVAMEYMSRLFAERYLYDNPED